MAPGYVTADQVREGDPYEVSNGYRLECLPTGARGSRANLVGASVLDSDPAVKSAGVDAGFSPTPKTLRAPDIAIGDIPDAPGWIPGAPQLAVEYADIGQDENALRKKIKDLFVAKTMYVWVVRMDGPRRVEVYKKGSKMRTVDHTGFLRAPGILKNPVPVVALYDREAAHEATLRNLLQRKGFKSVEDIQKNGHKKGVLEGQRRTLLRQLRARFGELPGAVVTRIESEDSDMLDVWTDRILTAQTIEEVLA